MVYNIFRPLSDTEKKDIIPLGERNILNLKEQLIKTAENKKTLEKSERELINRLEYMKPFLAKAKLEILKNERRPKK